MGNELTEKIKAELWAKFSTKDFPSEWDGRNPDNKDYCGGKLSQRFWEYFKTIELLDLNQNSVILDMGGGAGGYSEGFVPVSGNISVTIGAGGLGGTNQNGANGGNSSFGSLIITSGGNGGNTNGQGGSGGSASGGAWNMAGNGGEACSSDGIGGSGGLPGILGRYGYGGKGSNWRAGSGSNGTQGLVIVYW